MMIHSVGVKLCSAECEGLPRLRGGGEGVFDTLPLQLHLHTYTHFFLAN